MRKLDLILENIRDEYMINVLEEGTITELETLKTKKFLNENLQRVRTMLVEEGALEGVKDHLANNWGKYLAGAGAVGAGAGALLAAPEGSNTALQVIKDGVEAGTPSADLAVGAAHQSIGNMGALAGQAADAAQAAPGAVQQAYQQAMGTYVPADAVDPMAFAQQASEAPEVRDPSELLAASNAAAGMEAPRVDPSRFAQQQA